MLARTPPHRRPERRRLSLAWARAAAREHHNFGIPFYTSTPPDMLRDALEVTTRCSSDTPQYTGAHFSLDARFCCRARSAPAARRS